MMEVKARRGVVMRKRAMAMAREMMRGVRVAAAASEDDKDVGVREV